MSALSEFFSGLKSVKSIEERDPALIRQVDGVFLHLKARDIIEETRVNIVLFSIFLSNIVALLITLAQFFCHPFTNLVKCIQCVIFTFLTFIFLKDSYTFSPQELIYITILAYLFFYAILNIKSTMDAIRGIIFDALDLFSFGTITKLFAKAVIDGQKDFCEFILLDKKKWFTPTPIAYYFHRTRHNSHSSPDLIAIEDNFLDMMGSGKDENILKECENYWRDFNKLR